jgi:hypothetical protein
MTVFACGTPSPSYVPGETVRPVVQHCLTGELDDLLS